MMKTRSRWFAERMFLRRQASLDRAASRTRADVIDSLDDDKAAFFEQGGQVEVLPATPENPVYRRYSVRVNY